MKHSIISLGLLASIGLTGCIEPNALSSKSSNFITSRLQSAKSTAYGKKAKKFDKPAYIKESIKQYLESHKASAEDSPFTTEYIDLNGDNVKDALTLLSGVRFCGSGGCTMLIHQGVGNKKFKLISVTNLVKIPITINDTKTKGWRDITVQYASNILFSKKIILRFDGKGYPSNAAKEPRANDSNISGEKLTFLQTGT
ncbi:hypothetical protein [Mastigocoleus testarum]|uniref:Lipoprotein n=1 Tax=Mastigocoleus testarum BC008 TaxID=371196 RepID=A0A0V7ZI42_9CYAN|nr:hypothetical protein [Mastigocoleus testarum]KST63889.1 hypothetical protein BC008_15665 [Mastigocoleus testarum BC008]KST64224.1 hypothetical protein BC008_16440 [Mastigocoleus testarum BC008]